MLAIVIPYYKLQFFEETLQSLADQTNKEFKVYIGDDASPEDCADVLLKFKEKIDFIYHRFERNLGSVSLTQQWERCISLSENEEWLMVLGDDDVLNEDCIADFYRNEPEIRNSTANVIRFASKVINSEGAVFLEPFLHPKLELASDFYCRKVSNLTRSSLSEYVFKRELYNKYKFVDYPLAWHSDDKAWLDFSENKPIFTINQNSVFIRFSEINISGRKDNIETKLSATSKFYKDILKNKKNIFSRNQIMILLMSYELIIKRSRKVKLKEWYFLIYNYSINFRLIPLLKLFRRFIISIIS
ncbi:glycosyltransferase family 2 protein [Flavobacterium sp.]|uniref:glycosyltransferase family 2 protein n=1 Tax=Flavobacterium sp. TaxID=239 RepID=UPI003D104953